MSDYRRDQPAPRGQLPLSVTSFPPVFHPFTTMKFLPGVSLLLTAVLSASNSAKTADWTEFRGPTGQGHAEIAGLPVTWNESQNIAWKVPVPGRGWSSPVVSDGRIYMTTAVKDGSAGARSLRVLCLNAEDGNVVWNQEAFQQRDNDVEVHRKNSHASPTPILEGDRLYVHFGPHGTACLKTDGSVVWENQSLVYAPQHGNGGSPALADNLLIICCDGRDIRFVVGLDKQTGQQIWRRERDLEAARGFSFSTPAVVEAAGRSQAICPGSSGVWSYDSQTGEQVWRVSYGEGYSVIPRPVAGHGLVYVCSGYGDGQLFAIDPAGRGDVTDSHVKWKRKRGVPMSPSLLLVGRELYMVSDQGIVSCLDADSGNQYWQERLPGEYSASPVFADGRIYFQNETGVTTVILPGRKHEKIAENRLGDGKTRTFASFAFVDHAILLRSETHLYRIQNP